MVREKHARSDEGGLYNIAVHFRELITFINMISQLIYNIFTLIVAYYTAITTTLSILFFSHIKYKFHNIGNLLQYHVHSIQFNNSLVY